MCWGEPNSVPLAASAARRVWKSSPSAAAKSLGDHVLLECLEGVLGAEVLSTDLSLTGESSTEPGGTVTFLRFFSLSIFSLQHLFRGRKGAHVYNSQTWPEQEGLMARVEASREALAECRAKDSHLQIKSGVR